MGLPVLDLGIDIQLHRGWGKPSSFAELAQVLVLILANTNTGTNDTQ